MSAKGGDNPTYLKGAVTATPIPSQQVFWNDPAVQKCVRIIKKAYPSTVIGNPIGAPANAPTTWVAAENTCQEVAIFSAIAKAAGKNLTARTFQQAGYGLRNVSIPGMGAPVSFDRPSLCSRTRVSRHLQHKVATNGHSEQAGKRLRA